MKTNYKLVKAEDGIVWCTLQPLMGDIQQSIEDLAEMDTSELSEQNQQIFDLKILGLKTVYEFLGALIQEQQLSDLRNATGNITLNTQEQSIGRLQ
jgi:hypothetical protein